MPAIVLLVLDSAAGTFNTPLIIDKLEPTFIAPKEDTVACGSLEGCIVPLSPANLELMYLTIL
jgi:hypothetical protein